MSSQFSSNNPTGYLGISQTNPGQDWFRKRDPLPKDFKNYSIGDRWINQANDSVWFLTNNGSVIIQCAVSDVIKVLVQVGGSTKTVSISSAAGAHTTLQISKIA